MLSAILHSAPNAELFSTFYKRFENDNVERFRTKATLVVVSSARKSEEVMHLMMF